MIFFFLNVCFVSVLLNQSIWRIALRDVDFVKCLNIIFCFFFYFQCKYWRFELTAFRFLSHSHLFFSSSVDEYSSQLFCFSLIFVLYFFICHLAEINIWLEFKMITHVCDDRWQMKTNIRFIETENCSQTISIDWFDVCIVDRFWFRKRRWSILMHSICNWSICCYFVGRRTCFSFLNIDFNVSIWMVFRYI